MKRLVRAPNLAIATLWSDWLCGEGVPASVQRAFASSIAGEIPPDQSLPEVWIEDAADEPRARSLLDTLAASPQRRWVCATCQELVEGPFEQCWNCGAAMPLAL